MPAAMMAEELIAAYPTAKVILTNRNVDDWIRSMEGTVIPAMCSPFFQILRYFDSSVGGPLMNYSDIWNYSQYGQYRPDKKKFAQGYLEHYDRVRGLVPKERLLQLDMGSGWGPLCTFLDVPVPNEPYPNTNDAEMFSKVFTGPALRQMIFSAAWKIAAITAVGVAAAWYHLKV